MILFGIIIKIFIIFITALSAGYIISVFIIYKKISKIIINRRKFNPDIIINNLVSLIIVLSDYIKIYHLIFLKSKKS